MQELHACFSSINVVVGSNYFSDPHLPLTISDLNNYTYPFAIGGRQKATLYVWKYAPSDLYRDFTYNETYNGLNVVFPANIGIVHTRCNPSAVRLLYNRIRGHCEIVPRYRIRREDFQ